MPNKPSLISKILWQGYDQYLLPLGGKKVPTPYRRNDPYQPDRSKYGKSDPETLLTDTIKAAQKNNFDLDQATTEEIRQFMGKNLLGIDCSGFAYHLLDLTLKEIGLGGMEKIGFPKASRTNVETLISNYFTVPIANFSSAQAGDLIKLNSREDVQHCALILQNDQGKITYAQSSGITSPKGVHTGKIVNEKLPSDLNFFTYDEDQGDGVRRLKILA